MSTNPPGGPQPRDGETHTPSTGKKRGKEHAQHIGLMPINTNVTRVMSTNSKAAQPNTSTTSGNGTPTARQFSATTALYPTGIWSPSAADVTQSATMPTKAEWESFGSAQDRNGGRSDFIVQSVGPPTAPLPGLGIMNLTQHQGSSNKSTQYRFNGRDIFQPSTSPLAQDDGLLTSTTFPLMQHPFGSSRDLANQPRQPSKPTALPAIPEIGTIPKTRTAGEVSPAITCSLNTNADAGTDETPSHTDDDDDDDAKSFVSNPYEDQDDYQQEHRISMPFIAGHETHAGSIASQVTDLNSKTLPNQEVQKALVLEQESHPSSFARKIEVLSIDRLGEAFEGALEILKALNASHCTIEPGARLVCIKTDYVDNIYWSVKRGRWCTMDKVGHRIMRLWNEYQQDRIPVYLLFSINGQKSYCGLARMTGPWTKGGNFEEWKDMTDGTRTFGTMPVVWKYVKNVSFEWFNDIKHAHNAQPIVNMWNGMHFPHWTGLKVIEMYVTRAHFTNIMVWRKDSEYKPFRNVANSSQLDPRFKKLEDGNTTKAVSPRGPWKGGRGNHAPNKAIKAANWREGARPQTQFVTPRTRDNRFALRSNISDGVPAHDGTSSPVHQIGKMVRINEVPVIIDEKGAHHVMPSPGPFKPGMHGSGLGMTTMPSQQQFVAYNQQLRHVTQAPSPHLYAPGVNAQVHRGRGAGYGGARGGAPRGGRGGMQNAMRGGPLPVHYGPFGTPQPAFLPPPGHQGNVGLGIDLTGAPRIPQGAFPKVKNTATRLSSTPTTENSSVLLQPASFANFVPTGGYAVSPFGANQLTAPQTVIRTGLQPTANRPRTVSHMPEITGSPSHSQDSIHDDTSMRSSQAQKLASTSDGRSTHATSTENALIIAPKNNEISDEDKKLKIDRLMNKKMAIETELTLLAYETEGRKEDTKNWIEKSDDPWEYDPDWRSTSSYEDRHISPVLSARGGTVLRSVSRNNSISPNSKAFMREENRRKRAMFQADLAVNREICREVSKLVDSPEASAAGVSSGTGDGQTSSGGVALD